MASGVDRRTANQMVAAANRKSETIRDGVEDPQGFRHDFRANAVAGENCDAVGA